LLLAVPDTCLADADEPLDDTAPITPQIMSAATAGATTRCVRERRGLAQAIEVPPRTSGWRVTS
jgi:hypothetical protein